MPTVKIMPVQSCQWTNSGMLVEGFLHDLSRRRKLTITDSRMSIQTGAEGYRNAAMHIWPQWSSGVWVALLLAGMAVGSAASLTSMAGVTVVSSVMLLARFLLQKQKVQVCRGLLGKARTHR